MILLRLISWQYVRKHMLRSTLTVAGIVLGVSVFVGMHTANQSVLYAFRRTVDRIAGKTELQVSAGDSGFPEDVLERVQSAPEAGVAVPVIEAVASTGIRGQGNLLILAIDMTGDRSLREYDLESGDEAVIDDPLVFLAQPDSLIVTRQFAERNGLQAGSKLPLDTMEGRKQFVVRGILKSGGLTSAFGGNLAVMDVYAAQAVFGRGRTFDRVDLAVKEGYTLDQCRASLEKRLGPGFQVEPPAARGQHFESMARAFSLSVNFSSIFALLIGMFIIYNSFAIAVTQRRSEIGILRALGATARQIRVLYLGEGIVAGVIGSAAGVLFGILMARGVSGYVSALMGEVYGMSERAGEISGDPKLILLAMFLGVLTSVVAAILPARSAARVDPVKALQKGRYQVLSAGENRMRRIAAALLLAVSAVCLAFARIPALFYTAYILTVVAALLLTPALALWLARALRPALKRLLPVEGTLAADSLIQAPRRTSATVAALMLSVALAVGFAGIARAAYGSLTEWMRTALNPNLFVSSTGNIAEKQFRFPASMGDELKAIDGVDTVQRVRTIRVPYRGTPISLISVEIASLSRRVTRQAVQGDLQEAYRLAAEGKAAIVSDNLSLMKGVNRGDILEVPSPSGMVRLPVAAVTIDFSDQQGSVLIDRSVFTRYWKDDTVNIFRIYLKKGVSDAAVKERILEKFGGYRKLFVFTNDDLRRHIVRISDQWFGMTYIQLGVAVLVAILGIVNSLTVSITDRRRELGVLQAVGGLRRQIRRTIWMEAISIGIVGLVLGLALGAVCLFYDIRMVRQDVAGLRLSFDYPVGTALLLLPVILGAAFVSSLGPAEKAVRGSLVEALEYE